jgi:hypothetical protein
MPPTDDLRRTIGVVLAKSPRIILKVGWRYLRVKKKAQRAEIQFRKKLMASGMDQETAYKLADKYASTVSIRQFLKQFGFPRRTFGNDNRK